jgi:hypothetical protein
VCNFRIIDIIFRLTVLRFTRTPRFLSNASVAFGVLPGYASKDMEMFDRKRGVLVKRSTVKRKMISIIRKLHTPSEENWPLLRAEDSKVDVRGWGAGHVKRGVLLSKAATRVFRQLALLGFAQILRVAVKTKPHERSTLRGHRRQTTTALDNSPPRSGIKENTFCIHSYLVPPALTNRSLVSVQCSAIQFFGPEHLKD